MAMIMGNNIEIDIAGHSTTMTNWVKNSSNDIRPSCEGQTLADVIDMISELLIVKPTSRVRNLVILDLARLIVANGINTNKDSAKFVEFVNELNEYIDNGITPTHESVKQYGDIINNNKALSSQYSRRVIAVRHEVMKNIMA
jgi:hypothetical protein